MPRPLARRRAPAHRQHSRTNNPTTGGGARDAVTAGLCMQVDSRSSDGIEQHRPMAIARKTETAQEWSSPAVASNTNKLLLGHHFAGQLTRHNVA
jgi:hypothetical protein